MDAAEVNAPGASQDTKLEHRESFAPNNSQTASDYIDSQLRLEADAREALPYQFDSCTQPLGALRQSLFSCLTCNPPPSDPKEPYKAAGICYSCSISCHGEHTLVELFNKRDFVCDCGTTRLPSTSPCTLRNEPKSGTQGVYSETPAPDNKYNHNFQNIFCSCGDTYDPIEEKGTMFQCLGLGNVETGGCGEDWYHPECLLGLPRNWAESKKESRAEDKPEEQKQDQAETTNEAGEVEESAEEPPLPPGFPAEDDFETFICYKCLDSNPWLKQYAGTPGFLPPVYKERVTEPQSADDKPVEAPTETEATDQSSTTPKKRKADEDTVGEPEAKRTKDEEEAPTEAKRSEQPKHKHDSLPANGPTSGTFSLFLKEDFRDHICHCATCFPNLAPHAQLREEEETYEPPLSEDGDDAAAATNGSQHTSSLLNRGEAALSNVDRVRAIEGVMVYNHLRDKVKEFLKPFAENGQTVGAEDIKAYFEKLRGDHQGIHEAGSGASRRDDDGENGENGGGGGDNRREQSGEFSVLPPL
ncbi:hypothetical protein AJ80_09963 [Polytolypa hystricis UAMH7299]|uniref:UBR-type domain-containing protein n=1 Tax=Polytolypa hystricis (strain UAMH7299) TaxID=1447883 RepID=A0A2B7W7D4_POLH7|nr:hypothetical protein AJ80_09963 [Polytolypa hystricis UAMH7299]